MDRGNVTAVVKLHDVDLEPRLRCWGRTLKMLNVTGEFTGEAAPRGSSARHAASA